MKTKPEVEISDSASNHSWLLAAQAIHINSGTVYRKTSPLNKIVDVFLPTLKAFHFRIQSWRDQRDAIEQLGNFSDFTAEYEIVSFDFFDTLVTRQVEPPEYVLLKVAELSVSEINRKYGIPLAAEDYLAARASCESALRFENKELRDLDAEAALPDILQRVLMQFRITDQLLLEELLDIEVRLEADVLALNEGANELLARIKKSGKIVVVLSDMYLTSRLMEKLTDHFKIGQFIDKFYVSGELGICKATGELYKHLVSDWQTTPGKVIHIGDNHHSDYVSARKSGLSAKWLYQPRQLHKRNQLRKNLLSSPDQFVELLIQNFCNALYNHSCVLEREIFTRIAPAIYVLAYRSLRAAASLRIQKMFFLAREGLAIRPIFELLLKRHPEFCTLSITFESLYCSRASTICGRISDSDNPEELISVVAEKSGDFTFKGLLSAWNIEKSSLETNLIGVESAVDRISLLYVLKKNPDLNKELFSALRRKKRLLSDYFRQVGLLDERCGLVDVGWSGTIQKNIELLGGALEIFGFYLGTNTRFEARNFRGQLFSASDYRTGSIHKSAGMIEALLSVSSVGTTVDYQTNGDSIIPIFKESGHISPKLEQLRDNVFSKYYELFEVLTRKYCLTTSVLSEHARVSFFKITTQPKLAFVKALRDEKFNFDWGDSGSHDIAAKLNLAEIIRPFASMRKLWSSPWLFGSLKLSHLSIFAVPTSWLLSDEGKLNRVSLRKLKQGLGI